MKLTEPQRIALAYVDEGHWTRVRRDVRNRLITMSLIRETPQGAPCWGYETTPAGRAALRETEA